MNVIQKRLIDARELRSGTVGRVLYNAFGIPIIMPDTAPIPSSLTQTPPNQTYNNAAGDSGTTAATGDIGAWITANPMIAAAGVLAVVYLITKSKKKK